MIVKKNSKLIYLLMAIVLVIVSGCSNSSSTAESDTDKPAEGKGKTETIKVAYNLPQEHAVGLFFETMAEEIEKNTADTSIKLDVQTFPNGQLYTDADIPDALSMGGVHIAQLNSGFIAGKQAAPLRVIDLPFLFENWEQVWAAEDGKYGELFAEHLKKFDMEVLGWPAYGTVEIFGNFPIHVPDDIKGKKMRAFGQGASLLLEEMGASPVSMSSQEIYQAMEHGTIDGHTTGPSSVVDRSLYEVTSHGTDMGLSHLSFQAVANLKWFNDLPSDVQEAVRKAAKTAEKVARDTVKKDEEEYKKKLAELGVELYKPTDAEREEWLKGAEKRYQSYLDETGEAGQEFLDAVEEAKK